MANTKISQLTPNTNPNGNEELVYAYNNTNGKMSLSTMKTFANTGQQAALVSGVNIKTINNTSILGSGNIDVSGGGGGGFEPTELGGDANIWELSEGVYETTHDLYYKTGNKVSVYDVDDCKQMIFVNEETTGGKGFIVFNVSQYNSMYSGRASFGYSKDSSTGECYRLGERDWALNVYEPVNINYNIDSFQSDNLVQIVTDASGTDNLRISNARPGLTYTVYVDSISSAYTIGLGNGVTNPLGITLPTSSTKKCVVTVLMTSSSTGIVTGCTIEP